MMATAIWVTHYNKETLIIYNWSYKFILHIPLQMSTPSSLFPKHTTDDP